MKKSVLTAALAVPIALAQAAETVEPEFLHVIRTGEVRVDAPPHQAFWLFTGPGEELWIEEWDPTVFGGDGLEAGTVFTTDAHEKTYWIVVDFDRESLHARYARVAPHTRAGTVDVRVRSDGADGSVARVTYELTALSQKGNEILSEFTEEAYAEMMTTWEQMIRDADIDYDALSVLAN